jgi:hypothetical protein
MTGAGGGPLAPTFGAVASVATGSGPTALVLADLNGDGRLDAVTSNNLNANVSVFFGASSTTAPFAPSASYTTVGFPDSVVAIDLNGDSKLDLAVGSAVNAGITILLNNGSGGFSPGAPIATAGTVYGMASADVNGDGVADLTAAEFTPGGIEVFVNHGNATFAAPVGPTTTGQYSGIAVADLDGDHRMDLVASSRVGGASVFIASGALTWGSPVSYGVGSTQSILLTDLNADGKLDIVTTFINNNNLSIFFGDGLGAFTSGGIYPMETSPNTVAVGDLNHDGLPDIVVGYFSGSSVSLLLGTGGGHFVAGLAQLAPNPIAVAIAELDGNGRPELITVNGGTSTLDVRFNTTP